MNDQHFFNFVVHRQVEELREEVVKEMGKISKEIEERLRGEDKDMGNKMGKKMQELGKEMNKTGKEVGERLREGEKEMSKEMGKAVGEMGKEMDKMGKEMEERVGVEVRDEVRSSEVRVRGPFNKPKNGRKN